MTTVKTSWPAMLYGAFAVGLMIFMAALRRWGVEQPANSTWDAIIIHVALSGIIFAGMFGAFHVALSWRGVHDRSSYAAVASLAAVIAFALRLADGAWARMETEGTILVTFALPAAVGAMVGYLYHTRAGYSEAGDNPARLAAVLRLGASADHRDGQAPTRFGARSLGKRSYVSGDLAHVDTGEAEYFDGPLQVRTSVGSMIMAAFGATFLTAALHAGIELIRIFSAVRGADPSQLLNEVGAEVGLSLALFLSFVLTTTLPFVALIALIHQVLRAFGRADMAAYALAGLLAPIAIGILTLFSFAILGLYAAVPSAIAMVLYRRLAGVEPKDVMADIQVRDKRALVGANHARRQFGRVIHTK